MSSMAAFSSPPNIWAVGDNGDSVRSGGECVAGPGLDCDPPALEAEALAWASERSDCALPYLQPPSLWGVPPPPPLPRAFPPADFGTTWTKTSTIHKENLPPNGGPIRTLRGACAAPDSLAGWAVGDLRTQVNPTMVFYAPIIYKTTNGERPCRH